MLQAVAGMSVFVLIAWVLSENRSRVNKKVIVYGVILQVVVCMALLRLPFVRQTFLYLNELILVLESATKAGTSMVFGYLGGGPAPFEEKYPQAAFVLAFRALPLVLLVSALSSLLFYWKILPAFIRGLSRGLQRLFGIGGVEGVGVSANIFVGMVEAPLFIRPYLNQMTRSELFTVMTCGMATIAGTVMALYAVILNSVIPDIMGHILTASIISVPASIVVSKTMIPEEREPTVGVIASPESASGAMEAVTNGTMQGVTLLLNIVGMLIVLVAMVHLANTILGLLPHAGGEAFTLQRVFGWMMAPVAWLMGVSWVEAPTAGALMGTKTVLNELLAYLNMSQLPEGALSEKSLLIMTYAMCGFANPGSLGIMIGGMGTMAPERKMEIVSLGFRSILAGTLATCMTGAVVGLVVP